MALKITTNHVPRNIISGYELTEKELRDLGFDYMSDELINGHFFRYKGEAYDLRDFEVISPIRMVYHYPNTKLNEWDGIMSDTYFSGILVKCPDEDTVIVGMYYVDSKPEPREFVVDSHGQTEEVYDGTG
jgi:hypothetical protein